tara:strand:- start:540 stop:890 length:351 start_codon:yes stop_codon:yes gene_type:complete
MPDSISLRFNNSINSSTQVGDTIYRSVVTNDISGDPILIGECTAITSVNKSRDTVTCNIFETAERPAASDFILFTKDNKANLSSLKGYYAEVVMSNDSYSDIELFSVGSEVSINSK